MAFNPQHGNLTRVSSAPTVIQDIGPTLNFEPPLPFTGPLNADFQPVQNFPMNPSGAMLGVANTSFPNPPLMMPTQGSMRPFPVGTVHRNTGIPPPSLREKDQEERQLNEKLCSKLQHEQRELFKSNTGECRVICGERSWKVHECIVAPKCEFFSTALKWKREGGDKTVDMSGDDPQAIDILLQFLYTRSPAWVRLNIAALDQRAQLLVKVAIVADKYDQPDLIAQVSKVFRKWMFLMRDSGLGQNTKDVLLALIKLREHDSGCKALRDLQGILCRFLRDSGQLQRMDTSVIMLLEGVFQTDPALAVTLLQCCSAGPFAAHFGGLTE